jgi:mannose-6-phosphate isomerase
VQVHPDDEAARTLCPGEGSKTEAWFILDAQPGSRVYAGLKPGIDSGQLREALARGTVADCLHSFEPQAGDCLFLKAGTVHAVGGGVLLAEVQQTSDATFRLFDWNRRDAHGKSRSLHVEQALACINWDQGPVYPLRVSNFRQTKFGPVERTELVRCPYFELACLRSAEAFALGGSARAQILTVIHGTAHIAGEVFHTGDTCLLPAALPRLELHSLSGVALLLTTVLS